MKAFSTFSFLAIFLCGCVASVPPSSGLKYVKLGMTKEQVAEKIGEPTVARGGLKNKFGQTVEVYEYRLALPSDDSAGQVVGKSVATIFSAGLAASAFKGERRDFWLYFHDGKLIQWGQAGDWRREADRIYEFRF